MDQEIKGQEIKKNESASRNLEDAFFSLWADHFFDRLNVAEPLSVAVSGGPDSMVLCDLVARAAEKEGCVLYVYTVDHNLRADSSAEAKQVADWVLKRHPHAIHKILSWQHDGVESRIQEQARTARYDLMFSEMKKQRVRVLMTAHHQDDQAETFLFRLAKGSGLDGLAGMADCQEMKGGMFLCRPLLNFSKAEILSYALKNNIPFVSDPSNENEKFARVRLRRIMNDLSHEGLSAKRLAVTAGRMLRARNALEKISDDYYNNNNYLELKTDQIVLINFARIDTPEEIKFRVFARAVSELGGKSGYGVRRERLERVFEDLLKPFPFKKRTIGGVIVNKDNFEGDVTLKKEKGKK